MKFSEIVEELSKTVPASDMSDYKRLVAGGYNIQVLKCKENEAKEYYELIYDIAEGEFKGIYSEDYYKDEDKDFRHRIIVSYKNGNLSNVKRLIEVVEQSNPGLNWSGAPEELNGALLGAVFQEEEYEARDGSVGVSISNFATLKTTMEIDAGEFKVPSLRKLRGSKVVQPTVTRVGAGQSQPERPAGRSVFGDVNDSDVPF